MHALVKYAPRDDAVEVREVPEPAITPDEVLLEVRAVGVCGSDVHLWRQRQSWPVKTPLVLGHEFAGVIAAVGDRVSGWRRGERVTCETAASVCGACVYCRGGSYNLCPHRKGYGAQVDGAMTRWVATRPQILHRVPETVLLEHAALAEPVCVAYNALVEKTGSLRPGDLVVVQGVGAIGMMAIQIARARGAGTVVALGTAADVGRLELARQLGAQYAVRVDRDDALALVGSLGDGFGADLVVDCTGASQALELGLAMVRPNGRITKIGWGPRPLGFSLDSLVAKAVTLQGTFSHTYPTWERVLGMIAAGQVELAPLIGGVYPLDAWRDAFLAMESGASVKSILEISV
jgi:alcohol dehydrogenase/L-iditol 2-dehydrogenase